MKTATLIAGVLWLGIILQASGYPSKSDSDSDEDNSQQQQQQNIDSDSLEEFTQKIQSVKGQRKPEKVQKVEEPVYDPCLDDRNIGPCKAHIPRYFFNKNSGNCELFGWGGCGKNGNNFKQLSECESTCAKHLTKNDKLETGNDKKESSIIELCEKPAENGELQCEAYIPRWTYNASSKQCEQYIWGGCAKTENNFASESLCNDACGKYSSLKGRNTPITTLPVPQRPETVAGKESENICDLPSSSGLCLAIFEKYYFNKLHNRCELFTYGGCGGNRNRFDTAEECVRACGGDTPTQDLECANVECPWALYDQYESLGCSPIYDQNSCCPTRYDCNVMTDQEVRNNTLDSRSLTLENENEEGTTASPGEITTKPQTCRYKGKMYNVGEMVKEASDTGSCRAGCICTDSHGSYGPKITCAQIECPEHLQGRPRGKEDCIPLYKKGACCAHDYHCPEELTVIDPSQKEQTNGNKPPLAKCIVDGETVYEGQRVYPDKSPCSKCLCEKNPTNATSLEGQLYCEKVDCGIEIYYAHYVQQGCAPVYYEKEDGTSTSCCPISWECPDSNQQESDNEKSADNTTPETSDLGPEPPKPPSTDSPSLPPNLLSPSPPSPPDTDKSSSSPLIRTQDDCLMEKEEGDCKGRRRRFFYNGVTKNCESFLYTGCRGNSNNFPSLDDCKNLCETNLTTTHSVPVKSTTKSGGGLLGRSRGIEGFSHSQPVAKAISLTEVDPCTLPKRVGRCKGYFPRFYYSPEENKCQIFVFGGCRPNGNNFYSKDSCEATCLNRIPVENLRTNVPAALAIPVEKRIGGDSSKVNFGEERPITSRIAKPTPSASDSSEEADPCTLLPRTGKCKTWVRRFYYDTDKKMCKPFTYGGCSGNANNFHTMEECDLRCGSKPENESDTAEINSPPTPKVDPNARCKLPKSPGSCTGSTPSYYYDIETKSCKLFSYTGCFGNANRFITQEDCVNVCKIPLDSEGGSTTTRETINQPGRPRTHDLTDSAERNTESHGKDFCKEEPAPGNCKEKQLRFYYDAAADLCSPFVFTGCNGNKNNFVTEAECMSSCGNKPTLEQLADEMVLSCTFGNKTIPLGETIGKTEYTGEDIPCGVPVCQCQTPPAVTCIQKMCPLPTTTTTTTSEIPPCPAISCPQGCTFGTGVDGCDTCDCDDNDSETETLVKKAPVKSVKG